jgi:carbon monoxide dehydrogenase subunit G
MRHMEDSIHVDAPVEHVWAFFFDTSHWADWMPRGEYSDFSGPMDQVGTTYVGGMRIMGHEFKSTYKVVEIDPGRLYHERGDMGPEDTYIRFEPDGDGTRLSFTSDFEMPGHMPRVIQDLMGKHWMERQMRQMLEDFKALAETTVPVPA